MTDDKRKKYADAKTAAGYKRGQHWVPRVYADRLRRYAEALCAAYEMGTEPPVFGVPLAGLAAPPGEPVPQPEQPADPPETGETDQQRAIREQMAAYEDSKSVKTSEEKARKLGEDLQEKYGKWTPLKERNKR